MRIALVHSFYSQAEPSGETVVVEAQVEALRGAGHEVKLIARHTDDLRRSSTYPLKAAATVASGYGPDPTRELRVFQPDVVHVHNLFPNFGTSWLRKWDGPLVATLHNFRPICSAATLYRDGESCTLCPDGSSWSAVRHACYRHSRLATIPLALATRGKPHQHPLLQRADVLICLSFRAAGIYLRYGIPRERIARVPNFIDRPTRLRPASSRNGWLYAGRLSGEKGVIELLDTWPPSESLDVVGSGPLEDEVRARSRQRIRFLGPLSQPDLLDRMQNYEGILIPSRWPEGLPTILLEALARGLPAIAAKGSSAADELEDLSVGAVFDFDRPETLASSLAHVRQDKTASTRCLAAAKIFSRDAWIMSVERAYACATNAYCSRSTYFG